jgi:hypothetical protein|tara:strand:+ start:138 stop:500 length:363 start_codon:yes stop_codon:yes gene_type:complete
MVKKTNLIVATLYSIILAIVEAILNWGDWQYAPLWIVDYLIVIILLSAVFVFKKNIQRLMLLLGWAFSAGVMYMVLFINLEPIPTAVASPNIEGKLPLVGLALIVSIVGIVLTIIDSKNN